MLGHSVPHDCLDGQEAFCLIEMVIVRLLEDNPLVVHMRVPEDVDKDECAGINVGQTAVENLQCGESDACTRLCVPFEKFSQKALDAHCG